MFKKRIHQLTANGFWPLAVGFWLLAFGLWLLVIGDTVEQWKSDTVKW